MYAIYNSSDMLAPFYINFNMTGVGVYNLAHGLWKMGVSVEYKKRKLWNKWHCVENRDCAACVKYAVNFLVAIV